MICETVYHIIILNKKTAGSVSEGLQKEIMLTLELVWMQFKDWSKKTNCQANANKLSTTLPAGLWVSG